MRIRMGIAIGTGILTGRVIGIGIRIRLWIRMVIWIVIVIGSKMDILFKHGMKVGNRTETRLWPRIGIGFE